MNKNNKESQFVGKGKYKMDEEIEKRNNLIDDSIRNVKEYIHKIDCTSIGLNASKLLLSIKINFTDLERRIDNLERQIEE